MADKFMDKVKYFLGFEMDDEYEDQQEDPTKVTKEAKVNDYSSNSYSSTKYETPINTQKTYEMPKTEDQINVTLFKPKNFNDAAVVVDNLKQKKPVVINLQSLDVETARKIFDFCSGAVYSLDGQISKISSEVFLLAPSNVDIYTNIPNTAEEEY
jgi:cell division inhibitor SepF